MSNYGKIKDKNGQTTSQYKDSENVNRKANRTGDTYEHVGQNKAAHQWTTSGSSTQQAHEANVAREQKIKNQSAPVKVFTPEEKAAMSANLNAHGSTLPMKKEETKYADLPAKCPSCKKGEPTLKGHTSDVEPLTWWHCPSCETTGVARLPENVKKGEGGVDDTLIKTHPEAFELYGALSELKKRYVGFEKLKDKLAAKGASDPGGLAAAIGRKKYGKKAMADAAAKGKKMSKADEPHKDDPHHEEKEQEAASKIKEKAQQILDMHNKDK